MRIFSREGDILTLIVLKAFLALETLLALLITLKIFLIILKARVIYLTAFLDLITATEAITKYIRV